MDEVRQWQPWRLGQLWRLWRLAQLWRLWRLTQLRWVRPLVGTIAALTLVIGALIVFEQSDQYDPTQPSYINTDPVVQPLPTDHWPGRGN
ncbi:hypothetical protein ABZ942_19160 [Nocardia sp. NPDC046473]|uniref:hypothetical protein n=1 Tax=Nocardia sp. NPDC046473 TaxID=3155733 RepID=UPI0033E8BA80